MPEATIDYRTKQVIFSRLESGDFAIQVQREGCVRVDGEAFTKNDRVLHLTLAEHAQDFVVIPDFGEVTLAELMAAFQAFGEIWDSGGRTRQLILCTPAERLYSVICCRERLTVEQNWEGSQTLSLTVGQISQQSATIDGRQWTVPVLAGVVRAFCDQWAGD